MTHTPRPCTPRLSAPSLRALCLASLLAAAASPAPASAYHEGDLHDTADTAYTQPQNTWKVGIWSVEYGAWGVLDVGTYWSPLLAQVFNAHLKWQLWHNDAWAVAARVGLFRLDLNRFDTPAIFTVIPFELLASYKIDDAWRTSFSIFYSQVAVEGDFDSEDYEGVAAVSNLQLTSTTEWRLSRVWALYLHARVLVYQVAKATTAASFQPDDFTDVEVIGGAQTDAVDIEGAASLTLGMSASWESFNVRFGLGYGNYMIPGIYFVLPSKIPFPELDLYWRW
jgi:hypothetical protein